jgi:predicted DNA-binding transcriptional regulator AlpA
MKRWIRLMRRRKRSDCYDSQRFLRWSGLRRSAIYKYISEGRFPAPVKIGIRGVRWELSEVLAWQATISR